MKRCITLFLVSTAIILLSQCTSPLIDTAQITNTPTPIPPSHTPSPTNTASPSPTPTNTLTPTNTATPTITPTPTPTKTVIGGYPGRYLLPSIDEEEENHILSLHDANGDLIKVLYTFPTDFEIVGSYGATQRNNEFGDVKWSPNGDVYAMQVCGFRETSSGTRTKECDVNLFSSGGEPILDEPIIISRGVDWSPDGEWLAYSQYSDNGKWGIHLLKSDGSTGQTIVEQDEFVGYPAFSPDGSQLLYWTLGTQLRLVNVDGSEDNLIWYAGWGSDSYNWSPDGSRIGLSQPHGSQKDLYYVYPDGSKRTPIYQNNDLNLYSPQFSSDGKYILFEAHINSKGLPRIGSCFYTIPTGLSSQPRLVGSGWDARWSPDGSVIYLQGWPLHLEQSSPLSYYESPFYMVKPDASGYWLLNTEDIGLVRGKWQPGSYSDQEHVVKPVSTYEVPDINNPPDSARPNLSDFQGIWLNQDSSTEGVTRFEIRSLGSKILIRMWSACAYEDCYWGEVATIFEEITDNILQFIWDSGSIVTRSELHLISPARIELINHTKFLDDSGRPPRTNWASFVRVSGHPSFEPIYSCPPVLGDYDPMDYPYPKPVEPVTDVDPIVIPSPAPTHERYPQPPLYDSFDGDSLDTSIWYVPDEMTQRLDISQANGQLTISSQENPTESYHNYFDFRGFAFETNRDQIVYEAKLRINQTKNSAGQIGLSLITQKGDGWWGLHCALHSTYSQHTSPSKYFWCQANFSEYTSERIPIVFGVWYTLRMEFDREYGAFQVYLNGKLVDSFTPLDAEMLQEGIFYPKLGVGSNYKNEEESFEAQIDEVYITNPWKQY